MAHLASLDLSHLTVRLYLSAIRHMQIVSGMSDPALASCARLNYVLRGLRRVGGNGRRRARLPITPDILMKIYQQWSHVAQTYDHIMLWAAFCLGFFGFMRSGVFTCPSWRDFTVEMLSPQDVSVDSHISPSYVNIVIRRSKNDPFAVGAELHRGFLFVQFQHCCATLPFDLLNMALFSSSRMALHCQDQGWLNLCARHYQMWEWACQVTMGTVSRLVLARIGVNDSLVQTLGRWNLCAT